MPLACERNLQHRAVGGIEWRAGRVLLVYCASRNSESPTRSEGSGIHDHVGSEFGEPLTQPLPSRLVLETWHEQSDGRQSVALQGLAQGIDRGHVTGQQERAIKNDGGMSTIVCVSADSRTV